MHMRVPSKLIDKYGGWVLDTNCILQKEIFFQSILVTQVERWHYCILRIALQVPGVEIEFQSEQTACECSPVLLLSQH